MIFIGCTMLMLKWNRMFYVLLSFEFMMMELFYSLGLKLLESYYFCFICMCVMVSILGLLVLVGVLKLYGLDSSMY